MNREALLNSTFTQRRFPMARALLGLMLGLAASSAWSQNAAAGKMFYETPILGLSCAAANCHGLNPATNTNNIRNGANAQNVILGAPGKVPQMAFLAGRISAQNAADLAAYIANPAAANGASITLSGTTLAFGSTQIAVANTTTTPASITLTNSGGGPLTITAIGKAGTNAAEFTATGTCVGASVTVAAGGTCTIGASFTPTGVGNRTATFTLQSNASSNPSITLTGTATASAVPSISRSVMAITYNTQTVGMTSAARPVTITNSSTTNVAITAVTATPNPEFAATGTCVGNLAPGASCTMNVTFTPSAAGNRTGSLTITSNATGSPHAVTLAGPGTTTPTGAATLDASAVSFPSTGAGASANPLRTTLTNTGNAPLSIFAVAIGGANAQDFKLGAGTTCVVGSLAVNATCQVETEFKPLSAGSKTANAVIAHSAGTTTIALGGMANAATTTVAGTSPAAPVPTSSSALSPSNVGGGGALNPWVGLLVLLPALLLRRRPVTALAAR
jgi:hypothetical protein